MNASGTLWVLVLCNTVLSPWVCVFYIYRTYISLVNQTHTTDNQVNQVRKHQPSLGGTHMSKNRSGRNKRPQTSKRSNRQTVRVSLPRIRYAMIGGGRGAFIGGVHRIAALLDDQYVLVAGAFSSTPKKSVASGIELGLDPNRCYSTFEAMLKAEADLPANVRAQVVVIVTPNHVHFEAAKLALELGFHVICDKPVTFNLEQALALQSLVKKTGLLFCLTHNYTGYPLVKQMREMIRLGQIGKIREVIAEYPQGWLSMLLEITGQKQAGWRTDPKQSGVAGAVGDIGSHAENLVEYTTGLRVTKLIAQLNTHVKGRKLDDSGNMLVWLENGATGIIRCSQVAIGKENGLNIFIGGETGSLEWHQEEPNTLRVSREGCPTEIYRTGNGYLSDVAKAATRLPPGHPEGYLESFANLYKNFAKALRFYFAGHKIPATVFDFPSIDDGVRGLLFIEGAVLSSESGCRPVRLRARSRKLCA